MHLSKAQRPDKWQTRKEKAMGWFTNTNSSESKDTGKAQTDTYFGSTDKGAPHGHIAHDEDGNYVYGRDTDGSEITADQIK